MRDLERPKLFEAIALFYKNTNPRKFGLVKLFKLLYFLDMLHFRETGRAVTGLLYTALPYGPVPLELFSEMRNPAPDLADAVSITSPPKDVESTDKPLTTIKPSSKIITGYLTRRQQRIANELAEIFRDADADDMSKVSHARNGPWDLARKRGEKWNQKIDYFDSPKIAIGTGKAISQELLKARAEEFEEVRKFFA